MSKKKQALADLIRGLGFRFGYVLIDLSPTDMHLRRILSADGKKVDFLAHYDGSMHMDFMGTREFTKGELEALVEASHAFVDESRRYSAAQRKALLGGMPLPEWDPGIEPEWRKYR